MLPKKKRGYKIDAKIKAEVMEILKEPGYSIAEISRAYNISDSTLHKWKGEFLKEKPGGKSEQFVELSVVETAKKLTKASLGFEHLTVSFDGKISSGDLVSIIKILEVSSC